MNESLSSQFPKLCTLRLDNFALFMFYMRTTDARYFAM